MQLGFADDLLLFSRGDLVSDQRLFSKLQQFSSASGLQVNLQKSSIYFGEVKPDVQLQILELLGMEKGELPFRYLGVPLSTKGYPWSNVNLY